MGECYQCGKFGHVVKDYSDQGTSQQAEKPYGKWLKAGIRQKDMGAEWTKTNAPPPSPAPEPPQRATVSINSHDEVAGSMGINDNHKRTDNGSEINCPKSHVTVSQKIQVSEEVNTKLYGTEIPGPYRPWAQPHAVLGHMPIQALGPVLCRP